MTEIFVPAEVKPRIMHPTIRAKRKGKRIVVTAHIFLRRRASKVVNPKTVQSAGKFFT